MTVQRWTILGAASVAVVAGLFVLWRVGAFRGSVSPAETARAAERQRVFRSARERYEEVATEQLKSLTAPGAVRSTLEVMDFQGTELSEAVRSDLLDEVSEFIYYRFMQSSPEVYRQWRRDSGYVPYPMDELLLAHAMGSDYARMFNEPVPEDITFEELYDLYWPIGLNLFGDASRPVAIASDRVGLAAAVGELSDEEGVKARPVISGEMPAECWQHNPSGGTLRGWWRPLVGIAQRGKKLDGVLCAEVGVLIEYANGDRRPLVLTYAREPTKRRWSLEIICAYSIGEEEGATALEY